MHSTITLQSIVVLLAMLVHVSTAAQNTKDLLLVTNLGLKESIRKVCPKCIVGSYLNEEECRKVKALYINGNFAEPRFITNKDVHEDLAEPIVITNKDAALLRYFPNLDTLHIRSCWLASKSSNFDSIFVFPEGLISLYIHSDDTFKYLPPLPRGLKELDLAVHLGNQIQIDLPLTLQRLRICYVAQSALSALPNGLLEFEIGSSWQFNNALPARLRKLRCSSSQLSAISTLPAQLEELYVSTQDADFLQPMNLRNIQLPATLKILHLNYLMNGIGDGKLEGVPAVLPSGLEEFSLLGGDLKDMTDTLILPHGLKRLEWVVPQLPILPPTLEYLKIKPFDYTLSPNALPASLRVLHCLGRQSKALLNQLPNGLQELYCRGNILEELPERLPDSLRILDCSYNHLRHLPVTLPNSLKELYVARNKLKTLPKKLPDSLRMLDCSRNDLRHLPNTLPNSLKKMDVVRNKLKALPKKLPDSLRILDCSRNDLRHLPNTLPNSLKELSIFGNKLKTLPKKLPDSLRMLDCSRNHLRHLPATLPNSLNKLWCRSNRLRRLPSQLPTSLYGLYCDYNLLTFLNSGLPDSLRELSCGFNLLTKLPDSLPASLMELHCGCNQLKSLPPLPDSLYQLWFTGNNISCIPNRPILMDFDASIPVCK